MAARGLARLGAGRRDGGVLYDGVTGRGDGLLRGEDCAADGAVAARSLARLGAGGRDGGVLCGGVTSRGDGLLRGEDRVADGAVAARGLARLGAGGRDGGVLCDGVTRRFNHGILLVRIAAGAVNGLAAGFGAGRGFIHGVIRVPIVSEHRNCPGKGLLALRADGIHNAALGAGRRLDDFIASDHVLRRVGVDVGVANVMADLAFYLGDALNGTRRLADDLDNLIIVFAGGARRCGARDRDGGAEDNGKKKAYPTSGFHGKLSF